MLTKCRLTQRHNIYAHQRCFIVISVMQFITHFNRRDRQEREKCMVIDSHRLMNALIKIAVWSDFYLMWRFWKLCPSDADGRMISAQKSQIWKTETVHCRARKNNLIKWKVYYYWEHNGCGNGICSVIAINTYYGDKNVLEMLKQLYSSRSSVYNENDYRFLFLFLCFLKFISYCSSYTFFVLLCPFFAPLSCRSSLVRYVVIYNWIKYYTYNTIYTHWWIFVLMRGWYTQWHSWARCDPRTNFCPLCLLAMRIIVIIYAGSWYVLHVCNIWSVYRLAKLLSIEWPSH